MQTLPAPTDLLEQLAREHLGLQTLETRNSDSLDFSDVAVWALKSALEAAYQAGYKAGSAAATPPSD